MYQPKAIIIITTIIIISFFHCQNKLLSAFISCK